MADDSISYDVIVDFVMRNAASSAGEIEQFQKRLDALTRSGKVTEDQYIATDRALNRMASAFRAGLGGVDRYTKGFRELSTELQSAQRAFRELAQESAAAGSLTPASDAGNVLNLEDARKYLAIQEAASASVLSQSRKIVAAHEEEARSAREAAKAAQELRTSQVGGDSHLNAGNYITAQEEKRTAELANLRRAILSRAEAEDEATLATQASAQATQSAAENLPRLRYALYDVSSTLTMAGAGMIALAGATVGASVAMDRQFADVLRTTELYAEDLKDSATELRNEFNELFATMPASWGDLTEIGTLAGQLNIASGSVAEFTKLVAQFAATTDVSIEDSATAFGRLSQLLDVPASEFQNLGSSILAVGVNSVATESQIINISTQITSMAASAGFSADQVFGLSSALASLGTQPELSRGVITRLFTNINDAIQQGSERLDQFGAQIGKTGAEFAAAWGADASGTLLSLMEGIGSKEGPAAVATLNELGIVASRDVPTLLRLAQNSDVLRDSLATAAEGYADGTALADQYGAVALTVAERLKVLWNNVQLLFTAFGDTQSLLGPVIDQITSMVRAFTAIASNPIGQFFSLLTVGVIAAAGAMALLAGAATRGVAGLVAVRTAMTEMGISAGMGRAQISALIASLFGLDQAGKSVSGTLIATGASMLGIEKGAGLARNSVAALGTVMRTALPLVAISAGLFAATKGIEAIGKAMRSNQQVAEDYFGDLTGFQEALAADNAADYSGKVFGEISKEAPKASKATDEARQATESWLGIQREVPEGVDEATSSLADQNLILGENADAWVKNSLAQNEAVRKFASDPENLRLMSELGIDMQEFIAAGLEGGDALDSALDTINSRIQEKIGSERGSIWDQILGGNLTPSAGDLGPLRELESFINGDLDAAFRGLRDEAAEVSGTTDLLGESASGAAGDLESLGSAASDALSDFFDIQNGILGVQNSLFGLGESLAENGAYFDYFSEAGRENMASLLAVIDAITAEAGPNTAQAAANLQLLFEYIVQGAGVSADQLGVLRDAISELGGAGTAVPTLQIDSFFGGWASGAEKAEKATKKAKEEIITLSDYASDLASVWDRAFDIRFGADSSMDTITASFQNLRKEAEDSAQRVRDLRRDVADLNQEIKNLNGDVKGLQADRALQEYFLGVANQYGDTTRSRQIADQIREIDQEIANTRDEIAEKQREAAEKTAEADKEIANQSKTLVGNSAEAIANRNAIRELVGQYQDHIRALAESGLSEDQLRARTEQLRQDFINQATQLGFNRGELGMYAAAFDDVRVAIDNVPRNVNVSANVDPALQALNEFEAKARAAADNAADAIATGNGRGYNVPEITLPVKAEIQDMSWGSQASREAGFKIPNTPIFVEPGFASGGFTGRGGKYEPAGVVHRGEYVIPKSMVNQATGLPYSDALGRLSKGAPGRTGYASGGYVNGGGFSGAVVVSAFGPMAQQQLLTSQQTFVALSGKSVAEASSREFSNSAALGGA